MQMFKKTKFWENVKRSIAIFTGPTVVTLHEFGSADVYVMIAGGLGFLGGLISVWFTDHDNDGVVDLFQ